MDESLRQLEHARDAAELVPLLRRYAHAQQTEELRRVVAQHRDHLEVVGASKLGAADGLERLMGAPGSQEIRLVGWQLPSELGGLVLLEILRDQAPRQVAEIRRGSRLQLKVLRRLNVDYTTVAVWVKTTYFKLAEPWYFSAVSPELLALLEALAQAAEGTFEQRQLD